MSDSASGPAFMRLAIVEEVEQGQHLVRQRIAVASSEQRTVDVYKRQNLYCPICSAFGQSMHTIF